MEDLVEIRYVASVYGKSNGRAVVTRLLATGMVGIEMREIDKKGSELILIKNSNG